MKLNIYAGFIFSRAALCSLTRNISGLKSRGGRRADDARMTRGWRADDVRTTRERDFVGDFSWRMTYVIRTSSARRPHMHTSSAHRLHIIRTSSAPLLMVSVGLNYLLLWQEFVIWWNLWQECWIVSFHDHVNDLRDNLCCWFSLHVTSGHCSHLICICTYHLHIIWAYAYYAHIICTSPSYVLS